MSGSAWSNNSIQTLTIPTGATTGARIVIGNQPNGNAITIYNASNQIIFEITALGAAESIFPADVTFPQGIVGTLADGGISFAANGDQVVIELSPHNIGQPQSSPILQTVVQGGFGIPYILDILGGSADGTNPPTMTGTERNVFGSVVQSDQQSTNNLVHSEAYTVSTNAQGDGTLTHNAAFTPTMAQATCTALEFVQQGTQCFVYRDAYTSTQASFRILNANGTAFVGTMVVGFTFFG